MRISCLALLSTFLMASSVFAFPSLLSLDGYLTNSSGSALNGSYSFVFSLYNVSSGGSGLWTETQTVTVSSGKLNALLGSVSALNLSFDQDYYLGVKVSTDSEMSPRYRVASSAYAYTAKNLVPGANASGDFYVSGKLGIGTTSPSKKLDVSGEIRATDYVQSGNSAFFGTLWVHNMNYPTCTQYYKEVELATFTSAIVPYGTGFAIIEVFGSHRSGPSCGSLVYKRWVMATGDMGTSVVRTDSVGADIARLNVINWAETSSNRALPSSGKLKILTAPSNCGCDFTYRANVVLSTDGLIPSAIRSVTERTTEPVLNT